jgi:mannose-6-phosphate isomerase-like protein (cupin superfamily)
MNNDSGSGGGGDPRPGAGKAPGSAVEARADEASAPPQPAPMILRGRASQEYWFEEGCFITEWLNSPDDPSLSIARARVTPGVTTRLHRLAGVAERYVILQGQGRVELVGPDGPLTSADHYVSDVEPGDVVVIPPLVSQRISNIGDTDLIFLALCTPRFTRAAYEDTES